MHMIGLMSRDDQSSQPSDRQAVTVPRVRAAGDKTRTNAALLSIADVMTDEVATSSHSDADLPVDDEEEALRKSNAIDWNSLFAAVEDPELAEIMRSPIDSAVNILTTGKEVQKLSVIRTLTELIDTEGEECIEKVIPLIQVSADDHERRPSTVPSLQNVLKEEATNLDLHCEAAVVFKSIITDKRYEEKFPGLNEKLLNYILLNLENQKEYISAAAWLETLVEIADHIPFQAVTDLIVPLAVSQADPGKRVQRRVIATKLVDKLCTIISPQDVRKELAPCAQMLCQDPNPTVRTSIAQRLSVIAQSLNSSTDCVSLLLPCLIELCKDDDAGVREAILNTIAICLPYFTKAESRRTVVVPLLRKCTEQAIFLKDESLGVVSRQLGPWLDSLQDVLSDQERKWFLDTYCRIIGLTMNQSLTESLTDPRNAAILTSRRMCAYNFPCFVQMYGETHFTERLLPILEKFASDSDDEVRSAIAAGFHEIVALRPDEPTLIPPFIELIRGGASEVVDRITGSLHRILPTLYKCANSQTNAPKINRSQLDRIVIGCNRLIRGTGSWRSHESYLNNISCIRHLVPANDLFISFIPMLKQEVLTARALPCRIAAARTLFLMMREHPMSKSRKTVIDFFCHTIARHESCQRRRVILDVVPMILDIFSLEFFKEHIMEHVLHLASDKVSNIRYSLLYFPEMHKLLQTATLSNLAQDKRTSRAAGRRENSSGVGETRSPVARERRKRELQATPPDLCMRTLSDGDHPPGESCQQSQVGRGKETLDQHGTRHSGTSEERRCAQEGGRVGQASYWKAREASLPRCGGPRGRRSPRQPLYGHSHKSSSRRGRPVLCLRAPTGQKNASLDCLWRQTAPSALGISHRAARRLRRPPKRPLP
uniref:HEAT repeat protein n=1 Tax=Steinernema glaseri TaxID=37863 RepID=A0A1I7ZF91_9BILA